MSEETPTSDGAKTRGKAKNGNDQDEIASYAESTIKEMLGWYGLQDQVPDGAADGVTAPPSGDNIKINNGDVGSPLDGATSNGWELGAGCPPHDSNEAHSPASTGSDKNGSGYGRSPQSPAGGGCGGTPGGISGGGGGPGGGAPAHPTESGRRHGNRKLVGMRYLFPQLGEELSLYERAKIWVARHDHKYFVGYTERELQHVDSQLRPLAPITPELYKLHMNRSEYCRNVKLKYCLESEDKWAQEFRGKLKKLPNEGGFSGLCQVKIAAAELWRKYSENYKGHQARYPNPKSKYKSRRGTTSDHYLDFAEPDQGHNEDSQDLEETGVRRPNGDTINVKGDGEEARCDSSAERPDEAGDNDRSSRKLSGSYGQNNEDTRDSGTLLLDDPLNSDSEDLNREMSQRSHSGSMVSVDEQRQRAESSVSSTNGRGRSESNVSVLSSESEVMATTAQGQQAAMLGQQAAAKGSPPAQLPSPGNRSDVSEIVSRDDSELLRSESRLSPGFPQRERSQSCIEIGSRGLTLPGLASHGGIPVSLSSAGGVLPGMPGMVLQQAGGSGGGLFIPTMMPGYRALPELIYPAASTASSSGSSSRKAMSVSAPGTPASSGSSTPTPEQGKKPLVFRSSDYKKSERGLSFLFPSLADQQLSLLDKVRITVLRHKHNYFLGWPEGVLQQLDPLVRPKMVVTRQLYKEYCHRNAMKYDSNLQFALESTEAWADEFRARLTRPPSEGGFHSLCEVKQEAGRLWREYSGRYKMHNVVKSQMDLNNEVSSIYLEGDLKEDFSSRAKQKMGESGDLLGDPTGRARPRAISDLTDDRSMRYRAAYMQGAAAAAAQRMDLSPEGLAAGSDFQRCRSPLNVSVGDDAPCPTSRRSSFVTSEESVSQGRSAASSPSPSSRSALSSPGPQPPPFGLSTAPMVTSRSANSSPLNVVGLVHTSLSGSLTASSRGQPQQPPHYTVAEAHSAGSESTALHGSKSRKRSFEMSSVGGSGADGAEGGRGDSDSPVIKLPKAPRVSIDSDSHSPREIDSTSDISTSTLFDKHSRKRSSGTSIESSKSEMDTSVYSKDLSPMQSPSDKLSSSSSTATTTATGGAGRTRSRDLSDAPLWDEDLANTATLFKPLPADCSVSEQLGIWMQRHRHNYFLHYNGEDLLQVQPRVRPQYLVTPDIYRRFISETMVSMFGKVNEILQSDMPWATVYQTRVDQAPADGGFSTIEEALTEALDLWNKHVEGSKKQKDTAISGIPPGWKHKREKAMERTSTPESSGGRERASTTTTTVSGAVVSASLAEVAGEPEEGVMGRERSSSWPQDPQYSMQRTGRRGAMPPAVGGGRAGRSTMVTAGMVPTPAAWAGPLYATTPNLGSVGFLPTVGGGTEFKVKQEALGEGDDPSYDSAGFSWSQGSYRYGSHWDSPPKRGVDPDGTRAAASTTVSSPSSSSSPLLGRRSGLAGTEAIVDPSSSEVLDLRRGAPPESPLSGELAVRSAAQLSRQLWGCRAMLQKVLGEDPGSSWHARLAPHLPRLQAQLGPQYTCPTSTSDCMVDLLLATLDQQLSKL